MEASAAKRIQHGKGKQDALQMWLELMKLQKKKKKKKKKWKHENKKKKINLHPFTTANKFDRSEYIKLASN